jgi:transposase
MPLPVLAKLKQLNDQAHMIHLSHARRVQAKPLEKTMSLIAAMSLDKVVSIQLVEGGVGSKVFENYLYQTLHKIRGLQSNCRRQVVVQIDNAAAHRSSAVLELCKRMRCTLVYSAQYSPWLAAVE